MVAVRSFGLRFRWMAPPPVYLPPESPKISLMILAKVFAMPETSPVILVIEDEPPIQKFLRVSLEQHGFQVIESQTGKDGLLQAASRQPDLVILDLGLPDMDGVEVLERIRGWSAAPVIVVSWRGKEQDKVTALDSGADDYLTKPFGVDELTARVRVAIRHATARNDTGDPVFIGKSTVDLLHRRVTAGDARST